ncbi:hypothetical protein KA107_03180 [Candidatus Pacearchaeota archaeon]|nr:hypothetical protein [Candidatus Pacearchaeota archaeon]
MKSQHLFDRLKQKSPYENFIKNNPDSYLYAIFCILSNEEKEGDKIQFDFILPKSKRIAIAEYPFDEIKVSLQEITPLPEKLNLEEDFLDFEDLKEEIAKAQTKNKDKSNLNKIIAVLKNNVWDITGLTTTVDILKLKIDSKTRECIHFKKENLMNFVQLKKK